MKSHLSAMRTKLAETLKINPEQVGIKATTNEQLGPVGREEGIAVYAVVLLVKE
jgi:2-C-methyl-D-erythritol 2,4-cyclodiphosphate synthase